MTLHEFALSVCIDLGKAGFLVDMDERPESIVITARSANTPEEDAFSLAVTETGQ